MKLKESEMSVLNNMFINEPGVEVRKLFNEISWVVNLCGDGIKAEITKEISEFNLVKTKVG